MIRECLLWAGVGTLATWLVVCGQSGQLAFNGGLLLAVSLLTLAAVWPLLRGEVEDEQ